LLKCALAALLAGPIVLAFFSGGYFDEPRVWAGLVAWLLVIATAILSPRPFPRSGPGRLALIGLALLAGWTLVSFTWAPVAGSAYHAGELAFLYLGGMLAAVGLMRGPQRAWVEPGVALGTLIVIGYGLSERMLPGLLTFQHSLSAQGRLEQPLTYWNAMGAVGAIGVVLCARLSGAATRPAALRALAAAAAAPLGLGLYLSFSRGALFGCVAGLLALVVLAPTRAGWRGIAISGAAAVLASVAAAPFSGVTSLAGSPHHRELEGAVVLVVLVVLAVLAAGLTLWLARREHNGRLDPGAVALPRHAGGVAAAVIVASFALFLVVGAKEKSAAPLTGNAARLTSLQSNRYAYWRVAWRAFKAEPLHGVGAGGWAVYWLRYRPFDAGAQDAHSLYIQTLAELGVVGLALLAAFLAGIAWAARRAWVAAPELAAGATAGFIVWIAHVAVDWDWQMPAVTLFALALAASLLALADDLARDGRLPEPAAAPR
jgi:hypothetical protein